MIAYVKIFGKRMTRSYAVDGNRFGVRFYEMENSNYINLSAGLKDYEMILSESRVVSDYLDEEYIGKV